MRVGLCVLACVGLIGSGTAEAQAPAKAGVDALGDPLPSGALARLGTLRFVKPTGIFSVAVAPDGKLIATAGNTFPRVEDAVWLWDAATGLPIHKITTTADRCLCFSEDGKYLAGGEGYGHRLFVWDVATGKQHLELVDKSLGPKLRPREGLLNLRFTSDGQGLTAIYQSSRAQVWI